MGAASVIPQHALNVASLGAPLDARWHAGASCLPHLTPPHALLRVYARENHALRERVEALEWLREVEALARDKEWWCRRYVRIGQKRYDRLISENIDTVAHARKEAEV